VPPRAEERTFGARRGRCEPTSTGSALTGVENMNLSDEQAVDLFHQFQSASRVLNIAVTDSLTRFGLLPSEFEVLRMLADCPDGWMRTGDLVTAATTTMSGMSRLVDRLSTQELVARRNSTEDRRVQEVQITEAGLERFARARVAHHRVVNQLLRKAGLDTANTHHLISLLAHLGRVTRQSRT